jgi:hypothetical protein
MELNPQTSSYIKEARSAVSKNSCWLGLACGHPSRRAQSYEARAPSGHARLRMRARSFRTRLIDVSICSNLGNAELDDDLAALAASISGSFFRGAENSEQKTACCWDSSARKDRPIVRQGQRLQPAVGTSIDGPNTAAVHELTSAYVSTKWALAPLLRRLHR